MAASVSLTWSSRAVLPVLTARPSCSPVSISSTSCSSGLSSIAGPVTEMLPSAASTSSVLSPWIISEEVSYWTTSAPLSWA